MDLSPGSSRPPEREWIGRMVSVFTMGASLACGNQEKAQEPKARRRRSRLAVREDSAALELRGEGKKHIECGIRIIKRREGRTRKARAREDACLPGVPLSNSA